MDDENPTNAATAQGDTNAGEQPAGTPAEATPTLDDASLAAGATEAKPDATPEPEPELVYDLKVPEDAMPQSSVDWFKQVAKDTKIDPEAAQGLLDKWLEQVEAAKVRENQRLEEAVVHLRKEWGDKFDANEALAVKTFKRLATPALHDKLRKAGLANDPEMLQVFHRIGSMMSEDMFIRGQQGKPGLARTAGGAPMLSFPSMSKE